MKSCGTEHRSFELALPRRCCPCSQLSQRLGATRGWGAGRRGEGEEEGGHSVRGACGTRCPSQSPAPTL
eukprot:1193796-Rhodomonas_salina.2